MKRISFLFIITILSISFLTSCGKSESAIDVVEFLELGEKYLIEMDYEQAVVQFLKVIEIEPMNPRGYTGAAEAYVALGNPNAAIDVLNQGLSLMNDNTIQTMLDNIIKEMVPESDITDDMGEIESMGESSTSESESEEEFSTSQNQDTPKKEVALVTCQRYYRADGSLWSINDYTYDDDGFMIMKTGSSFLEDGVTLKQSPSSSSWEYNAGNQNWYYYRPSEDRSNPQNVGTYRQIGTSYTLGILQHSTGYLTGEPYPKDISEEFIYTNPDYEYSLNNTSFAPGSFVWFYAVYEFNNDGTPSSAHSYSEDGVFIGHCEFEYAVFTVEYDNLSSSIKEYFDQRN